MRAPDRKSLGWRAWLVASLLALAPGCLIPPRAVVVTASGEVRAPDPIMAQRAAQHVEWTRTELGRRIPGLRDRRADVWVQKRAYAGPLVWMRVGELHAFTLESPALANPRIHVPIETYRTSIAHELVHALLGPEWAPLPAMLEEGLCDVMSVELADDPQLRLNLLVSSTIAPRLASTRGIAPKLLRPSELLRARESLDLHARGSDFTAHAYGLGYVLVDRIRERHGIPYLHELCRRASEAGHELIPASWVLDAADLSEDSRLADVLADDIDRALFVHLAESGELVRLIERLEPPPTGQPWSLDGILITYEAEILEDGGIQRRLVDLPGFRTWARDNRALLDSYRIE